MLKRVRAKKASSKSKSMTLASAQWSLFDYPQLIPGEDPASYRELLARIRAAVKPVDIIDDMFIADVASLEWEVLRWRRLKMSWIRVRVQARLEETFPTKKLEYDLYSDRFTDRLTEILQENLPENQEAFAQTLAKKCAQNEPDAVNKVNKILARIDLDLDDILEDAQAHKAKELVQQYGRHEPGAVKLVNELFAQTERDVIVNNVFSNVLDHIERIDRLATVAEGRRNTSLREIERRRAVLGETLRRSVQEVEDAQLKVIEATPAKGPKAA
jgi:hypothetical protein